MCGRYVLDQPLAEIAAHWQVSLRVSEPWSPTWNAAPSQTLPVIIQDRLGLLTWGWQRRSFLINARGEEAHLKPTFAEALQRRRCLVPVTAFYEWTPDKRPHAFARPDRGLLAIAGLWARDGFVLLTLPAGSSPVAAVHHRRPALVRDGQAVDWLAGRLPILDLQDCAVEGWPVGSAVNRAIVNGPELLDRLVP